MLILQYKIYITRLIKGSKALLITYSNVTGRKPFTMNLSKLQRFLVKHEKYIC